MREYLLNLHYGTLTRKLSKGKGRNRISFAKYSERKSYVIYELVKYKRSIFKIINRVILKDFKSHYNINKDNRIVGWTPDYVGYSKSRGIVSYNYLLNKIRKNINEIRKNISSDSFEKLKQSVNSERFVFGPGFDTCSHHLKEIFKDDNEKCIKIEEIVKILEFSDFKYFPTRQISYEGGSEIFNTIRINGNAFSGHYTSRLFGREKYRSDYVSREIAMKLFSLLKDRPMKNLYLWSILGRYKDIKIDDNFEEVGTRAIMTCENPATTLLMYFSQRLYYLYDTIDYEHKAFHIGDEYSGRKMKRIYDKGEGFDFYLSGDWIFFDSNQDSEYLKLACALICCNFPQDRKHKHIAYYISQSIIQKYVILPPGVVVELNRGMASGHPFTSLVNCILNTIYWCVIAYKIYGENYAEKFELEVYGDDAFVYFKYHENLFNLDEIIKEIGLKSEPLLPNLRIRSKQNHTFDDVDFLKRYVHDDVLIWNKKKVFDKIIYPSKNRNINDQIRLLYNYFVSCKTDKDIFYLCKIIFKDIKNDKVLYNKIKDDEIIEILNDPVFDGKHSDIILDKKYFSFDKGMQQIDRYENYFSMYTYNKSIGITQRNEDISRIKYMPKREVILLTFGLSFKELIYIDVYRKTPGGLPPST